MTTLTRFRRSFLTAALVLVMGGAAAPSADARPPRRLAAAKTVPAAPKTKAAAAAKRAAQIAAADPQTMVTKGKRPAFFDPADLSKPPVLSAPAAIVIDADTGQTLWGKNPDMRRYPASTTKILTALLFIENTQPGDLVTCNDPKITQIEPSTLHIQPGEQFSAQDLLYGFLLRSANDGAVLVAEHVAGSVPRFAGMMNARAQSLGATHSHFVTPNGLHDPNHYTTARDMARIARAAMQNPRFVDAVSTPERVIARSIYVQDTKVASRAKKQFFDKFFGADGVKTGYTHQAGQCFVGSATRDGRRLLSVVFGSRNSGVTDTIPLLEWSFRRFPAVSVATKDDPAVPVAVSDGLRATVPTIAGSDLHVTYDSLFPRVGDGIETQNVPAAKEAIHTEAVPLPDLSAPIARGTVVGRLIAHGPSGEVLGEAPLLAAEDVARSPVAGLLGSRGRGGGGGVGAARFWLIVGAAGAAGAAGMVLVRFWYATAFTKSPRRRRGSVPPTGGRIDRVGPRPR